MYDYRIGFISDKDIVFITIYYFKLTFSILKYEYQLNSKNASPRMFLFLRPFTVS